MKYNYGYNARMNSYTKQQVEIARKRRYMYYMLHTDLNKPPKSRTAVALARRFGISAQRMSWLLLQAAKEIDNASEKN